MRQSKIGLLPFYIELYDQSLPWLREHLQTFVMNVAAELGKRGLLVETAEFCRVSDEFRQAVEAFERSGVDALVTVHPAYSPSLESAGVLAKTRLPLIVLDTTPRYELTPGDDPIEIYYNHGIHGVQDMCSLLTRSGKPFQIEAGHWEQSDVLDRVAGWAETAAMAADFKKSRIGLIGTSFKGMGDFVPSSGEMLDGLGITVVAADFDEFEKLKSDFGIQAIREEAAAIRKFASAGILEDELINRVALAGLVLRQWLLDEHLSGFTINFQNIDQKSRFSCMPFLEISRAMSRGIGYAGEGDVITAALAGTLVSAFTDATFTEMFCPDWKGGRILLSHMGEANLKLYAEMPLLVKSDFPFTDVGSTVIAAGCFKSGQAVMVNLSEQPNGRFKLILSGGRMVAPPGADNMKGSVRGWFEPDRMLSDYLSSFSRNGGTHHSVLVYGDHLNRLVQFGEWMDWEVVSL